MTEKEISFTAKHDVFSNCGQDVFLNLLDWKGYPSEYLRASGWSFSYQRGSGLFGDAVDLYYDGLKQLDDYLRKHYGIILQWEEARNNGTAHLKKVVKQNVREGVLTGVYMDSYYCPWQNGYQNYHSSHLILVNGTTSQGFICADPYVNKPREILTIEDFDAGVFRIFTPCFDTPRAGIHGIGLLKEVAADFLAHDCPARIRQLAEDIPAQESLVQQEYRFDNPAFVQIVRKTSYISYSRKSFSVFLSWLSEQLDPTLQAFCSELSDRFHQLSIQWSSVSSKFVKYGLVTFRPALLTAISDQLIEIAGLEKQCADRIINRIENQTINTEGML